MTVTAGPIAVRRSEWKTVLSSAAGLTIILAIVHAALSIAVNAIVLINDDGILYVTAARLAAGGHLGEAWEAFKWPAYPLLIGGFSAITGLDALVAAKALNTLASVATFLILLRVTWELGKERRLIVCCGMLLLTHLWWNDLRGLVVRDHLFLMFMSAGILFQVRDLAVPSTAYKLGFVLTGLLAAAFRIEALAFVVLVPLLRLSSETKDKRIRYAAIAIACLAPVIAAPFGMAFWNASGRLATVMSIVDHRFDALREILAPWSVNRWFAAYVSIVLGLTVYGLVKAVGAVPILLGAYYGRQAKVGTAWRAYQLAIWYGVAGAIIAAIELFFTMDYAPRYGLLISFAVTIPAAFGLASHYEQCRRARRPDLFTRTLAALVIILMGYGLVGGVHLRERQAFVHEAAQWLSANVHKPNQVLSNNNQVMFYAGLPRANSDFLLNSALLPSVAGLYDWKRYEYVVLHVREDRRNFIDEISRELGSKPVVSFENSRGDRIEIFRGVTDAPIS